MKKIIFAFTIIFAFASCAFAASSGEGFFGTGEIPEPTPAPAPVATPEPELLEPVYDTPVAPVKEPEYQRPVVPPLPEYENTNTTEINSVKINSRRNTLKNLFPKGAKPENQSDNMTKVIKSYGFDESKTENLLERHVSASRAPGNMEKSDRYEAIFNEFPFDYYAAYSAAKANFDMGKNSTAKTWIDKALSVNSGYVPAIILRRQINGALERNRED